MSQSIYSQTIEGTSITLTNGGAGSDAKLLSRRDQRVKGLDVASGSTDVTIEFDYTTSETLDYVLLGNLKTFAETSLIEVDSWNGSSWDNEYSTNHLGANDNHLLSFTSASATKFRIVFDRTSTFELELASVFAGVKYTFPVNYYLNNNRDSFSYGEAVVDNQGYPYGYESVSGTKREFDLTWGLTKAAYASLEAELAKHSYHLKPFFFYDSNIDTNYRLVRLLNEKVEGVQEGANHFKVNLVMREI